MTPEAGRVRKHSVAIAGHNTSISLEAAFWDALRLEAARRQMIAFTKRSMTIVASAVHENRADKDQFAHAEIRGAA